jgi:hypothetical protein
MALAVPVAVLLGSAATTYVMAMVIWFAIAGVVLVLTRDLNGPSGAAWRPVHRTLVEATRAIEEALGGAGWAYEVGTPTDAREAVRLDVEGGLFPGLSPAPTAAWSTSGRRRAARGPTRSACRGSWTRPSTRPHDRTG